MALTGSFSGTTANSRIKPTITWSAVQSVEGNDSQITATLCYSRTNSGYTTGGTWKGTLTIGKETFTGSKYIEVTKDSETEAIRATARVEHDSYGQLSVVISATGAITNPSSSTLKDTQVSATVVLDTIPRASEVSAVDADIGSRTTVVVSRKNDTFTHSLSYQFGGLTGYIDAAGAAVAEEEKLSATTVNFLLPDSFYRQIPDDPSGVCTLTCRTYSGNTLIGSKTGVFTASAGYERCKPEVSGTVFDSNPCTVSLTGDDSVLVRYASLARAEISAQAKNGADITALRIGGAAVEEGVLEIENPAFETLIFEAADSRGYTASCAVPVTLIPYVVLTNNAVVQRTDPTSGKALLTLQGSCWNGNFGSENNYAWYEYTVDDGPVQEGQLQLGTDHTYRESISLTGLDYTQSHRVVLKVYDKIAAVTKTLTVHRGVPVFDWGERDFRFHVPVDVPGLTIGDQSLADYIREIVQGG